MTNKDPKILGPDEYQIYYRTSPEGHLWLDTTVMTDNISCPTHFPKDKTEHKVDSLNIYCETLCHNKVYVMA